MVLKILSVTAFAFVLIGISIFLLAKSKSKGIYDEYIEPIDADQFKLKEYIGAGMIIKERSKIQERLPSALKSLFARYMMDVRNKICELYGAKYADYYYEIHNAQKAVIIPVVLALVSLVSLIMFVQNDLTEGVVLLIIAPIAAIAVPFIIDYDLKSKIDERRTAIQMEFPEFVNKLILLINAGMTISGAWAKIVMENKKKNPLYDELNICMADIHSGKPEYMAYEEFGRRCRIKEIIKFTSIIVLNLRKGGAEIVAALREQSDECWEMRKATARRMGEKASSKLMLPMGIMLLGIMLVVVLPAVLSIMSS